jgi:hypothetical protein
VRERKQSERQLSSESNKWVTGKDRMARRLPAKAHVGSFDPLKNTSNRGDGTSRGRSHRAAARRGCETLALTLHLHNFQTVEEAVCERARE